MKTLSLLSTFFFVTAVYACSDGSGCLPRGTFCHPGNWHDCCCPDGCLGVFLGACFGTTRGMNGVIAYTIKDASNNVLLQQTDIIDENTIVSQMQIEKLVARFGNQTLYVDAHLDYYDGKARDMGFHKTLQNYKIN